MLITIICVSVLALGIILFIWSDRFSIFSTIRYLFSRSGIACIVFGSIAVVICGVFIMYANINPQSRYTQDELEYQILQEQVDNMQCNDGLNVALLTDRVIKYNQQVIDNRQNHDNPWVSWFYYTNCEKLPFVQFSREVNYDRE